MELAPPSASDLMLDFLVTADRSRLTVQELCRGGAAMGFNETVVRVALTRLVQQHKIRKVERGTYAVHPSYRPVQEDVGHWLDRLGWMIAWRGRWIAVHDPVMTRVSQTHLRRHRRALALRGFRTWMPNLHLRPDNLRGGIEAMRFQLRELGLLDRSQVFAAGRFTEQQLSEVMKLWDVPTLRATYSKLLQLIEKSEKSIRRHNAISAAKETMLLGRHVISQIVRDPLLPSEMIEDSERHLLVDRMRAYQANSKIIWARVLGLTDS